MWRATIRFSLDKDTQSQTRNVMANLLKKAAFKNVKTGTWEAYSLDSGSLSDAIGQSLSAAEKSGKLDHYWVHIEKLSLRQQTRLIAASKRISTTSSIK